MSESDSFIQEVTEEVRQDRMFALWKKWAPAILGGLAVIVAGAAGWTWQREATRSEAETLGADLLAAESQGVAPRETLAAGLAETPAAVIAELGLAAAEAEADDRVAALTRFEAVAARPDLARAYTDFARLQALRLQAEETPAEALAKIGTLTTADAPYRLLALELAAALRLNTGDVPGAHADLNTILADPGATEALRLRALLILTSSGGRYEQADG